MDAFFFPDEEKTRLFGVFRAPEGAQKVWIVAPPFGEEEKSARRTLTKIARFLENRGEASLLFSYRGTGDSEGDFADFSLSDWKIDLQNAILEARKRLPEAQIALLGVRLGASLALEIASQNESNLVLIEPLLSGRSFLSQQNMRKKLRADLTGEIATAKNDAEIQDLDGWPLSPRLRDELNTLDLRSISTAEAKIPILVLQVGPKSELSAQFSSFSEKIGAQTGVVVMPPFWNLLDYADCTPLLVALDKSEI